MRVIYKKPGKAPEAIHIENTLEALQGAVGGYIEVVNLGDAAVIVNEEGKLKGRPANFMITAPNGVAELICGAAVFCGIDGEEFGDVPKKLEAVIMSEWREHRLQRMKRVRRKEKENESVLH